MNRLAQELSPYLLQHAANPVDWYPWGDEACAAARRDDRPIFLSVGYSTCHWCHVMAHESFESDAVAAILNRDFVCIKVDREERPDIDRIYMRFVQATTGSGGWPMSVWLTPDLKPFHGGTYYPPDGRYGRPGFTDLLREIARVWHEDRAGVAGSADALLERLRPAALRTDGRFVPGPDALVAACRQFGSAFDRVHGGFGGAPKFPRPSELLLLLAEWRRTGQAPLLEMVTATLDAMAAGGIRDHVGGGFHRYSVDAAWRVPHFEKMLYDQAQLVLAYLEAAEATHEPRFADVAADTLRYVLRDLSAPDGGFYSAEDADSLPPDLAGEAGAHKAEGAFYLWRTGELDALLGTDAALVSSRFGMRPDGNAPSDPQGEFGDGNLLYEAHSVVDLARQFATTEADVASRLAGARHAMLMARTRRPRPQLDDKILAAWNGLIIAACARAGRVLGRQDLLDAAARAASFVHARMWDPARQTLFRRYRNGSVGVDAFAEDYAGVIWGALELAEAGGGAHWLEWARALQARQDELFLDELGVEWYATAAGDPSVLLRLKDDYDGAEPSAGSIAARNLLTLARLTGEPAWRTRAGRVLAAAEDRLLGMGRAVPMLTAALSMFHRDRAGV